MGTQEKKNWILRQTGALLHSMGGGLREHIEQSIVSADELELLEVSALMEGRDPEALVAAISRAKTRSELLLVNAERKLKAWEASCKNGNQRRRRKIIRMWYFDKLPRAEIARRLNQTENHVLNQRDIALKELSVYFFGADGLQRVTAADVMASIGLSE